MFIKRVSLTGDHQSHIVIGTEEGVHIRKEFNSHRIGLGQTTTRNDQVQKL